MPQFLTLGAAAIKLQVIYSRLYKRSRRAPALPGVVLVGRCAAVQADRLDELREALRAEGLLGERVERTPSRRAGSPAPATA